MFCANSTCHSTRLQVFSAQFIDGADRITIHGASRWLLNV